MHAVAIAHNFETAHRLPHLGGKCANLHGHSWWTEITIAAPHLAEDYTVAEFAALKAHARRWIDERLDHGAMLGHTDPLASLLQQAGCKVFRFGPAGDYPPAAFPTVEAVAAMLADQAGHWITDLPTAAGAYVSRVTVQETGVNRAEWTP